MKGGKYKSRTFSKVSYDEALYQKTLFLFQKYSKTHLQQSRTHKFSGVTPPDPRLKGRGEGGERRGEGEEGRGERGKGGEGNNSVPLLKPFRRLWFEVNSDSIRPSKK